MVTIPQQDTIQKHATPQNLSMMPSQKGDFEMNRQSQFLPQASHDMVLPADIMGTIRHPRNST